MSKRVPKGWVYNSGTSDYEFQVYNASGTVKAIFNEDADLFQGGTKLTATAAQLNGTNPAITITLGTHDYAAGAADWILSAAELLLPYHKPTNASGVVNAIIALATIRPYVFINATGFALTVIGASGTGIAIANAKTATVMSDGTNVIRITADA